MKFLAIFYETNRGLNISYETLFSPLQRGYFPLSRDTLWFTPHHFWLYFFPFCVYFPLLTSISSLSFVFPPFPSHFPLFLLPFHIFPQITSADIRPTQGAGIFEYINTWIPDIFIVTFLWVTVCELCVMNYVGKVQVVIL